MARNVVILLICVLSVVLSGCTPRTIVRKNPGNADPGIRYYRPKPWLLVTPVETITTSTKGEQTTTPGASFVNLELQYLPDFSEEYSISVRSGLGINNTSIKLEDGWNLTEIGQDLDSQTDENVRAISGLVEAIGALPSASQARTVRMNNLQAESNVPIGYYESVIGRDDCGLKQIYGWRYVGFAPMQSCPLIAGGAECNDCSAMCLYSLVFRHGKMAFVPLNEVPHYQDLPAVESNQSAGVTTSTGSLDDWLRRNFTQIEILDYRLQSADGKFTLAIVVAPPPELESSVMNGLQASLARELGVQRDLVEIEFRDR